MKVTASLVILHNMQKNIKKYYKKKKILLYRLKVKYTGRPMNFFLTEHIRSNDWFLH